MGVADIGPGQSHLAVVGQHRDANPQRLGAFADLGRIAAVKNDVRADGNYLDGSSTNTLAVVAIAATHCGLSGNEIRSMNAGPTALVMAHHVAFNNNRVIAPSEELVLIPTRRYVVMGNMRTTGNIRVLQADKLEPLPPPWDALNILL